MGYSILTQSQLNGINLNDIRINGVLINCIPRANVLGNRFILQGDQFTEYTRSGILQYINDNWSDWNVPL
jgi:hypothetical protein